MMSVVTYEGVIEHGQVRLKTQVCLPEGARVYVIVPDVQAEPAGRIVSPRLLHPEQVDDFVMQIVEEKSDAQL